MKPVSQSKHRRREKRRLLADNEENIDNDDHHHRLPVPVPLQRTPRQSQIQAMRHELTLALHNIRYIASHCAHESLIESIRDEWKFIATVIDRLQFVIFLTVTMIGSLALLNQVGERAFLEQTYHRFLGTEFI